MRTAMRATSAVTAGNQLQAAGRDEIGRGRGMEYRITWMCVWGDQTGSDLLEYGLIGCLIAVAAITSVLGYMNPIKSAWNYLSSMIATQFNSIT